MGFLKGGELFVTGRIKDVIIIRGRNHYPQDIENGVQKSHSALRANCGAAFSVEVEGEESLMVVQEVERTYLHRPNWDEVIEAINQTISLEHGLAIHSIVLLKPGSIPKTSSGKIQRSVCRQRLLDGSLQNIVLERALQKVTTQAKRIEFSLFYFSSNEAELTGNKYRLLLEGAKFADRNDFHAVWIPERHFHPFGGLYPEPSVLGSALAMITNKIRIRAGSVVLPLQNPIRVAEQWSIVDNLSEGRVDISFAKGWNPRDFVLAPENYTDRSQLMFDGVNTVKKLWRGESINFPDGNGKETKTRIYPLPQQSELAVWVTCSGGEEGFIEAGAKGVNVLTALLFQPVGELADKIALYRESRARNGYDPNTGHVTLMLHTFIASEIELVRDQVRKPFIKYLENSVDLWKDASQNLDELTVLEREKLLNYAFERYFQTAALFGTPSSCLNMVNHLKEVGVDEIACLIDFGVDTDSVLSNLSYLNQLSQLANNTINKEVSKKVKKESTNSLIGEKNSDIFIAQVPDAVSLTTQMSEGSAQTLKGESQDSDKLVRLKTSKIDFFTDSTVTIDSKNPESFLEKINTERGKNIDIHENNKFLNLIKAKLARQLKIDPIFIKPNSSFASYGIDSLIAVELVQSLEAELHQPLDITLLWKYPTIESFAQYLANNYESLINTSEQTQEIWEGNNNSIQKNESEKEQWIEGEL